MEEILVTLLILTLLAIIVMPFVILAKIGGLRRSSDEQGKTLNLLGRSLNREAELLRERIEDLANRSGIGDIQTDDPAGAAPVIVDSQHAPAPVDEAFQPDTRRSEEAATEVTPAQDAPSTPAVETEGVTADEIPEEAVSPSTELGKPEAEGMPAGAEWVGKRVPATSPVTDTVAVAARTAHQPVEREKSRFEVAAGETLRRIWSYIVVGEEHRPTDVSVEYAIATTWLVRVGVLVLVIGIGFFLKYSIDNNLIGPIGRVGLSIFIGIALLVSGLRLLGNRYHLLGQGLIGAGIATL
jgi:hypothetical protein